MRGLWPVMNLKLSSPYRYFTKHSQAQTPAKHSISSICAYLFGALNSMLLASTHLHLFEAGHLPPHSCLHQRKLPWVCWHQRKRGQVCTSRHFSLFERWSPDLDLSYTPIWFSGIHRLSNSG